MFYTASNHAVPTSAAAATADSTPNSSGGTSLPHQTPHSSQQPHAHAHSQQLQLSSAPGLQAVQVQVPVQLQVNQQSNYLNQALYQQWFQQQFQVQQQQQQQHVQPAHSQDALSFGGVGVGGEGAQLFTGYLDHHSGSGLDFHNLNGQVGVGPESALSLSTLQTFANQLQQVHTQQGQTFMLAPSNANPASYILTNDHHAPQPAHHQLAQLPLRQHHHHTEPTHQPQAHPPHAHNMHPGAGAGAGSKKKGGGQKSAASQMPPKEKPKPPKMKGTPNAYALFYKETYARLRAENPEWKASQIMAEAGKIWKVISGAVQDKYRSQAEALVQAQQQLLHSSKSSHKKQKSTQKRPMTAYQLFIREHFSQRQADTASMHAKDFLLKLSGLWKALEPEEKQAYQERAKAEKSRRETEGAGGGGAGPDFLGMPLNGSQLELSSVNGAGMRGGPPDGMERMDMGMSMSAGMQSADDFRMGDIKVEEADGDGSDMQQAMSAAMDTSGTS